MSAKRLFGIVPLQIAQALIGFGAIAAFTRLMSPEEFGAYALALSVSMLAHTLTFTWLEAAAFRYFAAAKAERRLPDHFATLIFVAMTLGTAAFFGVAIALMFVGQDNLLAPIAAFAASAAVFRFFTRIARESDRANLALERYAFREAIYLILGFGAGVACLTAFDFGAAAPFAGMLIAGVVVVMFDAPAFVAKSKGGAIDFDRAVAYAGYGAPLAAALAVDLGVQTLCRVILTANAGQAELGAYAAAFGLARPLDLMFMAAGAALAPLVLAAYEDEGPSAARDVARNNFILMAAITLPATIGLMLVAQPLSAVMVGEGLSAGAGAALPWLALAGLLAGFNLHYWSEAFQLAHRTGLRALIMLAPGIAQIALTGWLAPTQGAIGAAIAACASTALAALLLQRFGRTIFALPLPLGALARIGLAVAAMALAITALPTLTPAADLTLKVFVGAFTYAAAALAFNIPGARAAVSAVSQAVSRKLRSLVHSPFTDRDHARRVP